VLLKSAIYSPQRVIIIKCPLKLAFVVILVMKSYREFKPKEAFISIELNPNTKDLIKGIN
jgi:hypothetical protein